MFIKVKQLVQISGWCLDKGIQRQNNEDYLSIAEISQTSGESIGIYALADGIGGLEHGERASYTAVRAATQSILQQAQNPERASEDCQLWLQRAIHTAHSLLRMVNTRYSVYKSGTTLVLAMILDKQVYVANVGDSRAYIISQHQMRQISQDHSFAGAMVEAGAISRQEALRSPFRNTLTQAIGLDKDLKPALITEEICLGDYLLLCSDGLYSMVDEDEILRIIQSAASLQLACEALVAAANAAGGEDNIAVILVQVQEH